MPPKVKRRAKIEDVKDRHEAQLMGLKGVVGVGIGEKDKKPHIAVYVEKASQELANAIPKEIEGFKVRIEETGRFVAF